MKRFIPTLLTCGLATLACCVIVDLYYRVAALEQEPTVLMASRRIEELQQTISTIQEELERTNTQVQQHEDYLFRDEGELEITPMGYIRVPNWEERRWGEGRN